MFSILVIEDDAFEQISLRSSLRYLGYSDIHVVSTLRDAKNRLIQNQPSLIIADVYLKDESSLELVDDAAFNDMPIIFTSVARDLSLYNNLRDRHRFGFLIKPIEPISLQSTIDLILNRPVDSRSEKNILYISQGKRKFKVNMTEILWLESEGNYTTIVTESAKYALKKALKHTAKELDDRFIQCHQRFYVNTDRIDYIDGDKIVVDGHIVHIGITFRSNFLAKLPMMRNGGKAEK